MKRYEIEKGKVNISFIEYTSDVEAHTHGGMEIIYILEGEAVQHINGTETRTKKGDILFLDINCTHSFQVLHPLKYVNILFDGEYNDIPFSKGYMHIKADEKCHQLIFDMLEEDISKKKGYEHMVKGSLELLIAGIIRDEETKPEEEEELEECVKYIIENCKENLRLEEVSRKFNLSPSYFSQMLKKKYGLSFKQLVTQRRLMEVMNRLVEGSDSIENIYQTCGFNNKSYFYKQFYEQFGVKPGFIREYKNSYEKYISLWNNYR